MSDALPDDYTIYYIGPNDCKKPTCNRKQEFPKADDPYCIKHSLENWCKNE